MRVASVSSTVPVKPVAMTSQFRRSVEYSIVTVSDAVGNREIVKAPLALKLPTFC